MSLEISIMLGVVSLAVIFFVWWLIRQGKKIKECEYNRATVINLEKHQKGLKKWVKEVDKLSNKNEEIKSKIPNCFDSNDFDSIVRYLDESRMPENSKAEKN